ncbi:MAG TPA: NB-ARC domain-containing protein [Streptosporangiaceae bacterium]
MAADNGNGFGELVRGRRAELGLTMEQLAELTGLSVRAISDIERGRTGQPRRASVSLLADALTLAKPAVTGPAATGPATGPAAPGSAAAGLDGAGRQAGAPGVVTPRQLPAAIPGFAGRTAELATLTGLLERVDGEYGSAVAAVSGMAGVGKTALAVRWAHQVADRFPDGQLYADLRGFSPAGLPAAPGDVLHGFIEALGVRAATIPVQADARTGLYRSLLAGRRVLVLLDNATDSEQVLPLLPASPGCLALVTSRAQLTGLAVAQGATPVPLKVLSGAAARELLASRLGAARLAAEPRSADRLIQLTGGLPLALAVIAARAAAHPGCPLEVLADELADARGRLQVLGGGDASADVRAAFSWSCHRLSGAAARMFRLLSIHPGPDVTIAAAASIAGIAPRAGARDTGRTHCRLHAR